MPATASATEFAVWLDGNTTPGGGGNPILSEITQYFGAGSDQLVSTAQLDTPGFLNSFSTVVVSRFDAGFGTSLNAAAAANIQAYVGSGASEGGVALYTNDIADNLYGGHEGDPYDPDLDALFRNGLTYAAKSGHGYVGEFNGAVMGVSSNSAGFAALGLLPGSATAVGHYGPEFHYGVGPIGTGNPIDAGVTFPFTDTDNTTFLTQITDTNPGNVVDVYDSRDNINGLPAVLANQFVITGGGTGSTVPEPMSISLALVGVAGIGLARFRRSPHRAPSSVARPLTWGKCQLAGAPTLK